MEKPHDDESLIVYLDREGAEQRGTIEQILSEPGRGVETIQDAIALAWEVLCREIKKNHRVDDQK